MRPTPREHIEEFLAQNRIALVGVSRDSKDFSRYLMRQMLERGYDVVPVHPAAVEIEGKPCVGSVRSVDPPAGGVLVMTNPARSADVVRDCLAAGVRRIWLHRGIGRGAVDEAAVALCEEGGVKLVAGHCPLMFLDHPGFIHRVHGWFVRRNPERIAPPPSP